MALIWLILGVVLVLAELRHFAFYALFGAAGAFAAALAAVVWPDLIVVQLGAGVVVGGLGIWLVRPHVSSAFHSGGDGGLGRGVHGSLVGREVITLDVLGPGRTGHVRMAGESWLATSGSDDLIPAGTDVLVTAVEGTTLIVWPVGGHPVPHVDLDGTTSIAPGDGPRRPTPTPPDPAEDTSRDTPGSARGDDTRASDHPEGEPS